MGTRCDFYLGRGPLAQYLGSIGHDAYVDAMAERFEGIQTQDAFNARLTEVFAEYGEIKAEHGWPWPWRDSHTTDTVVAFDGGQLWTNHYDGCWAPLADFENPTAQALLFPDMRAALEATPEGRLSMALRFGTNVVPGKDPMLSLLYAVTMLLAEATLHVFEKDGHLWALDVVWEHAPSRGELVSIAQALSGKAAQDFRTLWQQRKEASGEREWDLLTWLRDTRTLFAATPVGLALDEKQPVYFGQPVPASYLAQSESSSQLRYLRFEEPNRLREGMQLLDLMVARAPYAFSRAVLRALVRQGVIRSRDAETWAQEPQQVFGGVSLDHLASSAEGRRAARAHAARMTFED